MHCMKCYNTVKARLHNQQDCKKSLFSTKIGYFQKPISRSSLIQSKFCQCHSTYLSLPRIFIKKNFQIRPKLTRWRPFSRRRSARQNPRFARKRLFSDDLVTYPSHFQNSSVRHQTTWLGDEPEWLGDEPGEQKRLNTAKEQIFHPRPSGNFIKS